MTRQQNNLPCHCEPAPQRWCATVAVRKSCYYSAVRQVPLARRKSARVYAKNVPPAHFLNAATIRFPFLPDCDIRRRANDKTALKPVSLRTSAAALVWQSAFPCGGVHSRISSNKSCQSGLNSVISLFFRFLFQLLICFSRSIAAPTSPDSS